MKTPIRWIVLCQLFAQLTVSAFADQLIRIDVNQNTSGTHLFEGDLEKNQNEVIPLVSEVGMFLDGNMYVRPYRNPSNPKMVYRDVYIVLPNELNANDLMKALVETRAAKTYGANQIHVKSQGLLKNIQLSMDTRAHDLVEPLQIEELFTAAGADFFHEKNLTRPAGAFKPAKNSVTQKDYWIGSSNHIELATEVAGSLNRSLHSFESLMNQKNQLKGRRIYWFAANQQPINSNFFTTLNQIQWLEKQGASVYLVSPNLPYARADKPEFALGVPVQGRLAADLIETVGTQGIAVVRAHAPQSLGFFKIQAEEISGRPRVVEYLAEKEVDCVISPDAGFQKDATRYKQELQALYTQKGIQKEVVLVVFNKQRSSLGESHVVKGTALDLIQGKKAVIIDDETSSGKSLAEVAADVKKVGPTSLFAVVTHLTGPSELAFESPDIEKLVITNTLPTRSLSAKHQQKLEVMSIGAEIKDFIARQETDRVAQ